MPRLNLLQSQAAALAATIWFAVCFGITASAVAQETGPEDGEPIARGKVVEIDHEAPAFVVESDDGEEGTVRERVRVLEDTEFSIRPVEGPDEPADPDPDATDPEEPDTTDGEEDGEHGDPSSFDRLNVGDDVLVFGEREEETGDILADRVVILQPDEVPGDTEEPIARGKVVEIDREEFTFLVES